MERAGAGRGAAVAVSVRETSSILGSAVGGLRRVVSGVDASGRVGAASAWALRRAASARAASACALRRAASACAALRAASARRASRRAASAARAVSVCVAVLSLGSDRSGLHFSLGEPRRAASALAAALRSAQPWHGFGGLRLGTAAGRLALALAAAIRSASALALAAALRSASALTLASCAALRRAASSWAETWAGDWPGSGSAVGGGFWGGNRRWRRRWSRCHCWWRRRWWLGLGRES